MKRIHKLKKIYTQGIILIKYIYYRIYLMFFKKKKDKYHESWLISERGTDARDNGYFFFKYIRECYPYIGIRYIIKKESPDFDKIKNIGDYIIYGSKEHYIAFISSHMLISTHIMGFSPDAGLFYRLSRYNLLKLKGKIVWLQHGITQNYLAYLKPKYTNLSLLITASKRESDYLISKNGFNKEIVKCTGFARFDNLKKVKSERILFMPTHRIYMHNMNEKEFVKSDYYKNINNFINNKQLINILNKNKLTLIFYIHYEFQKYLHLFNTTSQNIILANMKEYDVQELLINSCLLITDYSSVAFDFAYMEKPVIYYQFDYESFRKGHYEEGYFSYLNDGFGPVVYNIDDVIKEIELNKKNAFIVDKENQKKINDFFNNRDNHNCERIYKEIIKIDK